MDRIADQYIARSLKNWAARQKPPPETKQRLLEAAANPHKVRLSVFRHLIRNYPHYYFAYLPGNSWLPGPITQTRFWSLQIALEKQSVF